MSTIFTTERDHEIVSEEKNINKRSFVTRKNHRIERRGAMKFVIVRKCGKENEKDTRKKNET